MNAFMMMRGPPASGAMDATPGEKIPHEKIQEEANENSDTSSFADEKESSGTESEIADKESEASKPT